MPQQPQNPVASSNSCPFCQQDHDLDKCEDYIRKLIEERSKILEKSKLCYGCYVQVSTDHRVRSCKHGRISTICKERYPTGLHVCKRPSEKKPGDDNANNNRSTLTCVTTKMTANVVSMCFVPVRVKYVQSGKKVKTHAMLDCCSQGTFINAGLAKGLKASSMKTSIQIKTLNGTVRTGSVFKSIGKSVWTDLPVTYSKNDLSIEKKMLQHQTKPRNGNIWTGLLVR